MGSDNEIKSLVEKHGQLAALNTQQAAALLQVTEDALQKAREVKRRGSKGYAQLPFHSDGKRAFYYLTDLIEFRVKSSPHPLPFFLRTLAMMLGPDFCRHVGVPYLQPVQVKGSMAEMSPLPGLAAVLGVRSVSMEAPDESAVARRRGPKSKKADNLAMLAAQKAGATVRRHTLGFATLHDFLSHAEPDDQWLFACPAEGRPYDAIAAILAGPGEVRFEWMSLTDYLHRIATAAALDRDTRNVNEQQALIISGLPKVSSRKKRRSIDE